MVVKDDDPVAEPAVRKDPDPGGGVAPDERGRRSRTCGMPGGTLRYARRNDEGLGSAPHRSPACAFVKK